MEFFEVVYSRRSVRKYKPDMVPRDVLLKVLDAANWAPSGMDLQQWEFIVVSGIAIEQMGESYRGVIEKLATGWEDERRKTFLQFAVNFGGAPIVIVALTKASNNPVIRKMNLESVSAAFENLLLAACAEGLGSCWMMGPLYDEASIRRILDIPPEKEIVAITPIGYPDVLAVPPNRHDPGLKYKVKWVT
jgi:nitroreductase